MYNSIAREQPGYYVLDSLDELSSLPTLTAPSADGKWEPAEMGSMAHVIGGGDYILAGTGAWVAE